MDNEPENDKILEYSFEERQRLLGFFSILLTVDKRLHPELYKPKNNKGNESNNSSESIR